MTTGVVFVHEIPAIASQLENSRELLLYLAAGVVAAFFLMKLWLRQRHGRADLAAVDAGAPAIGKNVS